LGSEWGVQGSTEGGLRGKAAARHSVRSHVIHHMLSRSADRGHLTNQRMFAVCGWHPARGSVKFRAFVRFGAATAVDADKLLMFCPMPHQGKAEIVPLKTLQIPDPEAPTGSRTMLWTVVGRCRLPVSKLLLKARLVSALDTKMW